VGTDIAAISSPPLTAAVFSKDAIQILGSEVTVNGNDQSVGSPNPVNGVESDAAITGNLANVSGTPVSERPFSTYSYSLSSLFKSLRPPFSKEIEQVAPGVTRLADGSYSGTGLSLGQVPGAGDVSQATYVNGALSVSDSNGQGILIVNGDLTVTRTFSYYGLIIVKGKIHLTGEGTDGLRLDGAIICGSDSGSGTSILEGVVRITNDSAMINKQFHALQYARLAFREM
jgi:hypothetical protein